MAETVTIEIPVSVTDETSKGLESAQKNITSFEKSLQRTEQQLKQMDTAHNIDLTATDHASNILDDVESDADTVGGLSPEVEIEAADAATDVIQDVISNADELDGMDPDVDLEADDMATDVIVSAEDAADTFGGMSETAEIEVADMATDEIMSAVDAAETFGGMSESAEISANDSASDVIDSVTDKAEQWGKGVYTGTLEVAGSALGLLGISAGIGSSLSTYESFESTMSQVEAISGSTGTELEDLTAKAQEMGSTTKFTATEAAEAMTYMAMAGWEAEDMMSGIEGIMNLAAASGEDLASTSDIVTDALTAFGLSASDSDHFADVLATAASSANTTVAGMGETFKYAGSMAGTLGYSIEDVALMTGLMANAGIKGSMAGTSLNSIMTRLSTNTGGAADALEELGIDFFDSTGNARDLSDVIDELRIATADYNDEEKTTLANTIAGTQAQKGLLAILNASDEDYNSLSESISNADGAAANMAETMLDNTEGALTLMNSALDGVSTSLGERLAPYITGVANMITEAAPQIEEFLNGVMDSVDSAAEYISGKIEEMTSSEEWQEADFWGKVDIAWDTLIVDPFMEWISSDGTSLISDCIYTLVSNAVAILPGGDDAGLSSWLSAGLLVVGGSKIVEVGTSIVTALTPAKTAIEDIATAASGADSVGDFFTTIGSKLPTSATVAIGVAAIAAVATAIMAINGAIDEYNQKQISNSLTEHFGTIEITAEQAAELAQEALTVPYTADIELALGQFTNAQEFHDAAQKALEDQGLLEYKSGIIGIELSTDEKTQYTENVTTFIDNKIKEIEALPYSAWISVSTTLGGTEEGQALGDAISQWALDDSVQMTQLSNDLTQRVEEALEDGIVDVDEAKAIQELQEKMNSITSKWYAYENEAQKNWIFQQYNGMSGAALTSGGFEEMVNALENQMDDEINTTLMNNYTTLEQYLLAMNDAGRLGTGNVASYEEYEALLGLVTRNEKASLLSEGVLGYESNTMMDTYGNKINENIQSANDSMEYWLQGIDMLIDQEADASQLAEDFISLSDVFKVDTKGADQGAMNELYQLMKPDVTAMEELIDDYREAGQAVPQAVMDAYNEAIEIGAASGDSDAAWQAYANALLATGDEEVLSVLTDENNPLYADIRSRLPEELITALDRAMAETTDEPLMFSEFEMQLNGAEVTNLDEWLEAIQEDLGDLGTITAQSDVDFTVTVNQGDTLSEIGEAVGVDWHEIAEYNGLEDPYTIYPDMEIKIPIDQIEVDTSEVDDAIDEALESSDEAQETPYSTTVVAQAEAIETSDAVADAQNAIDEAFEEAYETDGNADIIYAETNNADEVYSEAGNELQEMFNTVIPVDATAVITVDYSISNPSARVQLSSGGTAEATITASVNGYATGGMVGLNGPELILAGEEGLEYIIPTSPGRRDSGVALWEEAGMALGTLDEDGNIAAFADGGTVGDETVWTVDGRKKGNEDKDSSVSVSQGTQGSPIEINVNMNPAITIEGEGMDEDEVVDALREHIREMADDLADEIAERMSKIYSNMPVIEEAS